jgi:glycosyltransferase involved in cell wall biosynthesis
MLAIAPQPFFSPRGTPLSVYYRTLVTAEMGVEVDLLTYSQGEDVDLPGVRIIRIPGFRFLGPVKVGPSLLKLWLDAILVVWTVALMAVRRYDVVHAHEEAVFFALPLTRLFRTGLIYDMHSSLPQQLSSFDFTRSRLLIGLFGWFEDWALRAADAVITISPHLHEYAVARRPEGRRSVLIENSLFEPVRLARAACDGDTTRTDTAASPPTIVYAGTLESYQGIDLLLDAFADVRESRPDVRLVIAGGTDAQIRGYTRRAEALGILGPCEFLGPVPKATASTLMRDASVLVSPRTTGNNTPLKLYEMMASGVPMVLTDIPSHTQVVSAGEAVLVEPSAAGLAAGLLTALESGADIADRVRGARTLYESRYSRESYEAKLRHALDAL